MRLALFALCSVCQGNRVRGELELVLLYESKISDGDDESDVVSGPARRDRDMQLVWPLAVHVRKLEFLGFTQVMSVSSLSCMSIRDNGSDLLILFISIHILTQSFCSKHKYANDYPTLSPNFLALHW